MIARYHSCSGNLNYKHTIKDCFNLDTVVPTISFPSLLENFSNNTQTAFNSDYFINKCTLLPIYVPFLPEKRRNLILNDMKYEKGIRISNLLGIQAGHILTINNLKYCPECAAEDYSKYNESYFHRIHQIEGIKVCSEHECFLKEYKQDEDASRLEFVCFDFNKVDYNITYENDVVLRNWYIKIAKSYEFLLSNNLYQFNNIKIHEMYLNYLDKKGFVTSSKRIKQMELADQFVNYYGEKLLNILNCHIDKNNQSNWLKNITRKPRKIIHPLRHILFINFLCGSLEIFFQSEINYHPFGKDPWPCLNIAADHYLKDVVSECIVTSDYKTRKPVGTFVCSCGFIYSRKGPEFKVDDRFKVGRIKQFGHIWEQRLIELINEEKYNLKSLSKKMNCDPKTIVKYANKLSVIDKINTIMKVKEKNFICTNKDYSHYKEELVNFIKINPDLSRTEIRNKMYKQYIWLYRHDKEWLMENLPDCLDKRKIDYKAANRVDWNERDKQISDAIGIEYVKIKSSGKLIRITKTILGRRTGYSSLLDKHIKRLPMTSQLLEQICESVEMFQMRRIKIVAEQLYEKKGSFQRWELVKAAGIKKMDVIKLSNFIDDIIIKI